MWLGSPPITGASVPTSSMTVINVAPTSVVLRRVSSVNHPGPRRFGTGSARGSAMTFISGGPEMAPRPPTLGRAPAEPWRASGTQDVLSSLVPHAWVEDDVGEIY